MSLTATAWAALPSLIIEQIRSRELAESGLTDPGIGHRILYFVGGGRATALYIITRRKTWAPGRLIKVVRSRVNVVKRKSAARMQQSRPSPRGEMNIPR